MKLLNRSLIYLSLTFLIIIGVWSVLFYLNLKDEIRDSIDDGLENNKLLIIQKVKTDTALLLQNKFGGNNFEIHPLSKQNARHFKERYKDTLMYRLNEDDLEAVRILHTAFKHKNNYYHLKIISSLVEEDDLIEDSFWSVLWLFIILVTSIIIINNIVLRRVWNPFYEILNRLKNYRLDKDEAPINIATNTKEFTELQNASNTLIHHSKEVYTSQKQFAENASHEMQTPLAIITNKLELLLESESLTDANAKTIADVMNIANRLTQINKSLLLLAKIENKQFPDQKLISFNELSKEFISRFQDFADFKEIQITIGETEHLDVLMDASLADILVANLVKNAVFHNCKGGKIDLRFTGHEFTICNTGTITALHPQKIFNRFQKDATKSESTGLGLAVCKAICDFYGISLNYHFAEYEHCFSVNFKKIIATA
jgi:signal transduction histidine kinase